MKNIYLCSKIYYVVYFDPESFLEEDYNYLIGLYSTLIDRK